jgi:hypothetical protein
MNKEKNKNNNNDAVWSDSNSETENKTSEELFQTFVKVKEYFNPLPKPEDIIEEGEIVPETKFTLLNHKKYREDNTNLNENN